MPQVKGQALRKRNCTHTSAVSLVPRPFGGGGPGIHCLRMRQNVPKILVHRKFFSKPLRLRLRNPVNRAQYYYANTWRSDLLISIQIEYGDI